VGRTYGGRHRRLDLVAMNGFETTVERWHDYYVAAGGTAAVLLGLLSISLSLHLDREASEYDVLYRVGTQTMIGESRTSIMGPSLGGHLGLGSRKLPRTYWRSSPKAPSTRFGE